MEFERIRRPLVLISLVGLCVLVSAAAPAASRVDLYQATVEVPGQSQDERNSAIGQALEKVLVKITGSRSVTQREQARAVLKDATALVQQYRYENLPAADAAQPEGLRGRALVVSFDQHALLQSLRRQGLPAWGSARPAVLLWLGIEQRGKRRFFNPETDQALARTVSQVVADRGISFLHPLLDVEDFTQLRAGDLWGGFETRLREASSRYGADLILVGRLVHSGNGWKGQWQLLHTAQAESWSLRGKSSGSLLAAGLQETVDRVAARYAPLANAGDMDGVLVRVDGLNDLGGYVRVERLFRSLDAVEKLALLRVEADHVLFRLGVRGGADVLSRNASLGGVLALQPLAAPAPGLAEPAVAPAPLLPDVRFRLNP